MTDPPWSTRSLPLLAAAIVLSALAYHPITDNYFHSDDFYYFYTLNNGSLVEFLFRPFTGHLFATRNVVFALWHALFGTEVRCYFYVVLATHLLNVALAFRLIRLCTGSLGLACAGALLWGVSPMHEDTLGWLAAYGNVLAATALLWLMQQLETSGEVSTRRAVGWCVVLVAMGLSSAIGLSVAMAFPIIVLLLRCDMIRRLPLFAGVTLALAAVYSGTHLWWDIPLLRALRGPADPAALLSAAVAIGGGLVGVGVSGLLFGPFLRVPGETLSLLAGLSWIAAVFILWLRAPKETARPALAWALIVAISYAAVFAGRARLLSGTGLSEILRYHYVPSLGTIVILCLLGAWIGTRLPLVARANPILPWVFVAAVAISMAALPRSIDHYSDERLRTARSIAQIRSRIEAAPEGSTVFIRNQPIGKRSAIFVEPAGLFVTFFSSDVVDRRVVRFIADDSTVAAARTKTGTRLAALLVTEREAR